MIFGVSEDYMIYLASPYSHPRAAVRSERARNAVLAAAWLIRERGEAVFSPIAHSHHIALVGALDTTWETWAEMDLAIISVCRELVVLQLAGWEQSKGVAAEVAEAERLGIPVTYRSAE